VGQVSQYERGNRTPPREIIREIVAARVGTWLDKSTRRRTRQPMMPRKQLEEIAAAVEGIPVWGCLPGSTAAEAGVVYGDIVLSVNGMRTQTIDDYLEARALRVDGMEVQLFRAGRELTLFVAFRPPADSLEALATQIADGRFVTTEPTHSAPKGLPS
jgi:PDZ domain